MAKLCLPLLLLLAACAPKISYAPFALPDGLPPVNPRPASICQNWENYLPDPACPNCLPERLLRVNFHILNSRDSSHNFKPDAARQYFTRLLALANADLDTNFANWRSPAGTPVLPKGYRYALWPPSGGFYFHFDDTLFTFVSRGRDQNMYDQRAIEKYAVGRDSVLNIFVQTHPPDSLLVPTYRAASQGIALGTSLKMAGIFESKGGPEGFQGLLNHEIGHILGLTHAWTEDGCPDTPDHPNQCYMCAADPPCDSRCTNNQMDYNYYQNACTPCQIGRIQATFVNEKHRVRRCLVPTWCAFRSERSVVVRDSVAWLGARDLEGDLSIAPGGVLLLGCRLSMPPGGKITVQPGGRLILDGCRLHQACGKNWQGILVGARGKQRGEVALRRTPFVENVPK